MPRWSYRRPYERITSRIVHASSDKMPVKIYKNGCYHTIDNKGREVCCKVSLYKNCQRQSCSAINCLSTGINILAGGSSVPLISESKGTAPIGITWRRAVLSADAGLLVLVLLSTLRYAIHGPSTLCKSMRQRNCE